MFAQPKYWVHLHIEQKLKHEPKHAWVHVWFEKYPPFGQNYLNLCKNPNLKQIFVSNKLMSLLENIFESETVS